MTIITKTSELIDICRNLPAADFITIDTEFIRETTFFPELCLVQVASSETAFAVDALAKGLDLQPLFDLLLNKNLLKVIHSGRQDLEIFFNLMGKLPVNIFDTQIAAMVCGFGESVSYETLVSSLTHHHMDKSQQSSNWKTRPLTEKQTQYALNDVIFLRDVYEKLKEKIEKLGRASWLEEENAWLLNKELYEFHPENAYKRLKPRRTDPLSMHILKELASWREVEARDRNIPKRRIVSDEIIMELAAVKPRDTAEIKTNRVLRGFDRTALAETLVILVQTAIKTAPPFDKSHRQPAHIEYSSVALDMVRLLLKMICDQEQVAAKLIASADELKRLTRHEYESAAEIPCLNGWRLELFGERALKVLNGSLAFGLEKGKLTFFER